MRDVNNSDPEATHLAHVVEEQIDLSTRDDRRRFIEDEKPWLANQRLGDLDHLLIGERKVADTRRSRDGHAETIERALDALQPRFR